MTSPRRAAWKEIGGRRVPVWVESEDDLALLGPVPESDVDAADVASLEFARKKIEDVAAMLDDTPVSRAGQRATVPFSDILRISAVSIPAGVASKGPSREFPAKASLVPLSSSWWDKVRHSGYKAPAIVRIDAGPLWSRLSAEEQSRFTALMQDLLEFGPGIKFYGLLGSGVSNSWMLKASLDPEAPSGNRYNLDKSLGDFIPAAQKASPDEVSPTAAGKMLKRDKADTVGGEHFFTPYPENITSDRVVPISGIGGAMNVPYTIVDNPTVFEWTDSSGDVQQQRVNTTDGGGDLESATGNRMYQVMTGRTAPRGLARVQVTIQARTTSDLQGRPTGGTLKAMLKVIQAKEHREKQRKERFSEPMRISSDGLAKELANEDIAHGRVIFHFAKQDQWEWGPASGLMAQPMLDNYFHLDEMGLLHFQHNVQGAFYASKDAEERAVSVADRINAELPRGVDENGTLDPLDDEYMRNVRSERTVVQKFQDNQRALLTGSPYASPGAMDAVAGGTGGKLAGLRSSGKGALSINIPVFKGKRTDALDLPDPSVEPRPGMVRLLEEDWGKDEQGRPLYVHDLVFNSDDMADPNQLIRQSGPDNDDEYNAMVGRDPNTGEYKILVWRDPIPDGSGSLYDAHPEDVRRLRDAGYPISDFRPDYVERARLDFDMAGWFSAGNGMRPETHDEATVKKLAWDMDSDRPEVAMKAKRDFAAMLLGRGRIAMITNYQGIAKRSGWLDSLDDWKEWAYHPDSLDTEIWASGHNLRTTQQMAEKIVGASSRWRFYRYKHNVGARRG